MSNHDSARPLLPEGAGEFTTRVRAIGSGAWDNATPCTDWSVRDLVNHLTSEHLWVPHLLGGESPDEVGTRYEGDVLGADPVAAWDAAIEGSLAAWNAVESDDAVVQLSFGNAAAGEYANQMLLDLTVHSWDLASGAGLDDRLDERVVEHVLRYAQRHAADLVASGLFDDPVTGNRDDPQGRLLGLLGRAV